MEWVFQLGFQVDLASGETCVKNRLKRCRHWSIVAGKQQNQVALFQSSSNNWFIPARFQDFLNQKRALIRGFRQGFCELSCFTKNRWCPIA